jgi:hypothetical protein
MFFKSGKKNGFEGGGLVLFDSVEEAMSGERALKADGVENRLVAPPPELRRGCDLALEINLVEKPAVERMLQARQVPFIDILPMKGDAELLQVVQVTDFGEAVMVKAGNMKLTFDKSSGVVLNISGGGCPDIPYLHAQMLDKPLDRAPRPKEMGHTLCSLMLDRAYVQSLEIWKNGSR